MDIMEYIVEDIDGDYAHLKRMGTENEEPKLVARALLPPEIMIGTRLRQEFFEYEIIS